MGWYQKFINRIIDIRSSLEKTWQAVLESPTVWKGIETFLKGLGNVIDQCFGGIPVLFLGPLGAGKTTLISYLLEGAPRPDVAPTPVGPPDVIERQPEIAGEERGSNRAVIGIQGDVSGESGESRDFWREMLRLVNPEGLILLMDGGLDYDTFRMEFREVLRDIAPVYADRASKLRVVYTFLHKYDTWRGQETRRLKLGAIVSDELADFLGICPALGRVRWGMEETHLAPRAQSWPEMDRALGRFKNDLAKGR